MEDDTERATNNNFSLQKLLDVAREDMPETQEKNNGLGILYLPTTVGRAQSKHIICEAKPTRLW